MSIFFCTEIFGLFINISCVCVGVVNCVTVCMCVCVWLRGCVDQLSFFSLHYFHLVFFFHTFYSYLFLIISCPCSPFLLFFSSFIVILYIFVCPCCTNPFFPVLSLSPSWKKGYLQSLQFVQKQHGHRRHSTSVAQAHFLWLSLAGHSRSHKQAALLFRGDNAKEALPSQLGKRERERERERERVTCCTHASVMALGG